MKLYVLKVMTSGADLEMEKSCWGGGVGTHSEDCWEEGGVHLHPMHPPGSAP